VDSERTVVVAPVAAGRLQHRGDRWFYICAGLFVILLAFAGFGPSIIDQSRRNAPLTPLVIAHGIVSGAWLLLFVTQATLVATRRIAVHRRLGLVGGLLAPVVFVVGYRVLIEEVRRGYELSGDLARAFTPLDSPPPSAAEFAPGILPPLAGFFNFAVLAIAGLCCLRWPDVHKRLMLLALTPLAGEPIIHLVGHVAGRWPTLQGAAIFLLPVQLLLFFASAIYDKVSMGRIHWVSLWVPILLLAELNVLNFVVGPSVAWQKLAMWLAR
jgi:hypothetical protein